MGAKLKLIGVILAIITGVMPTLVSAEQSSRMLITEVKLGGQVTGQPNEFVTIYNDSPLSADLSGWLIEYAKPVAKISDCYGSPWKQQDNSSNVKGLSLSGTIEPFQSRVIEFAMNDNTGGAVKLINNQSVADVVGWGNSISQGVCKEGEPAPLPANTKSIKRYIAKDGQYVDTNNNKADFTDADSNFIDSSIDEFESSQNNECNSLKDNQPTIANGVCGQSADALNHNCQGVVLSEILPNPSGTDTGKEYVELRNTTNSQVDLTGCKIKVGNTIKQLSGLISPGYKAFFGIVLPNASGGTVEFITNTTEEAVSYPANLKDNQAWSLIEGQWQLTEKPTPDAENIAYIVVEEPTVATTSSSSLEPCPEGKYRNPATNRCKTIETIEITKLCEPGQFRNPETNRCKKNSEVATNLKPCEPGQIRNPATNRCRKAEAKALLVACKEGQERNSETNRCRKIAGVSTSTPNNHLEQEVKKKQNISYGIFIAMAVLVLGYGVYEYRSNISNFLVKLKK